MKNILKSRGRKPRKVIELMVNILFYNDSELLTENIARTIYNLACGTGGMLSVADDQFKEDKYDYVLSIMYSILKDSIYSFSYRSILFFLMYL